MPITVRRSPHLVSYWRGQKLILCDYATKVSVVCDALVLHVLDQCTDWTPRTVLQDGLTKVGLGDTVRLIDSLLDSGLLNSSEKTAPSRDRALASWEHWNPWAGFFHMMSKAMAATPAAAVTEADLLAEYKAGKMPAQTKRYRRAALTPLSRSGTPDDPFVSVLKARRTWRQFSRAAISRQEVSTLLQLTAGVQATAQTRDFGTIHLKISPSSGARQPLEAYVLAVRVDGLAPGLYHYVPARHALELVKKGATARTVSSYIPEQRWYASAPLLFLLTAVFARTQWKYRFPRAYRSVLLEAGHVCQTFCLVSTWLGLAPFCTGRFDDEVVERDLRIDGVSESFIYGGGVGRRPPGVAWAPNPL